jgi:hypothetical protein
MVHRTTPQNRRGLHGDDYARRGFTARHLRRDGTTRAITDATTDSLLATLREQLAVMRKDRDHWRGVALGITRQIAETTTRQIIDQRERRPWWHRFRMTG